MLLLRTLLLSLPQGRAPYLSEEQQRIARVFNAVGIAPPKFDHYEYAVASDRLQSH